jgi:hypothetical protein
VEWKHLIDNGSFTVTADFLVVQEEVREAVAAVHWPPHAGSFRINPVKHGNGVKPIKDGFIDVLAEHGWELETSQDRFDALRRFSGGRMPFAVEWETGNVSSSHRAMNRIALATMEGKISGGVLVVPTRALYPYLTDRIGNEDELVKYYKLWSLWSQYTEFPYLGIVTVEHDALDPDVPLITKGTDGRALI